MKVWSVDEQVSASDLNTTLSEIRTIYGGTGADGALNVTSGTTTLNLGTIYNYTTINVSVGATLAFTGTGAAMLRATGAVTIAGTVELRGLVATSFSMLTSKYSVTSGTSYASVTVPNGEGGAAPQTE